MKGALYALIVWLSLSTMTTALAADTAIEGRYMAEDRDHMIELFLRGRTLFGRIIWTKEERLLDVHNDDAKLQKHPVVGIEHLRGLTRETNGAWSGGLLYNPENGETYEAKLWLSKDGRLIIQGRPRIAVFGTILGAMFGRIVYSKEAS